MEKNKEKKWENMTKEEMDEWYDERGVSYGFREYPGMDMGEICHEIKFEDIPPHLKKRAEEARKNNVKKGNIK